MIDNAKFLEILRMEFPELREELEAWAEDDYPVHLLMMEFHVYFEEAIKKNDWACIAHCLSVLDRVFRDASPDVKNAVYVSFLELIDLSEPNAKRLTELMSPELLHGHKEIDEYLIQLGTRKKSYQPATP